MGKISVSMIVKNEESCLRTALESVKEADEIVICDTGSTDRTVEIAREYTDKIFTDYKWNDDFAEARNHAASKCTGDYILIIDADEVLEAGAMERLKAFDGEALNFNAVSATTKQIHPSIRLHANTPEIKWRGAAHNYLTCEASHSSNIVMTYHYSQSHLYDPDRTFRILKNHLKRNPNDTREIYYLALEYLDRDDLKKAAKLFEKYKRLAPASPEMADVSIMLARIYYAFGNVAGAVKLTQEVLAYNPDFKEAVYLMGDIQPSQVNRMRWHYLAGRCENTNVLFHRERNKIIVTMLSSEDFAGSGLRIVKAVREAAPDIDIESIVLQKSAYGIQSGATLFEIGIEAVQDRLLRSDIIHVKGDLPFDNFDGLVFPATAKMVQTVGGSFFRRGGHPAVSFGQLPLSDYKADYKSALTPDLVYSDDWNWTPHAWLNFDYCWHPGEQFNILHAPSDPAKKGSDLINQAMQIVMKQRPDVNYQIAIDLPHSEMMKLKRTTHLYIDQLFAGAYGNAAIEAMSFGVPVFASLCEAYGETPVIQPDALTAEGIAAKILSVLDWNKLTEISNLTFNFARETHGNVGGQWAAIYRKL